MAHTRSSGPALPPRLVPVAPDIALRGALANLTRRLVAEHERLLNGQRRMAVILTGPITGRALTPTFAPTGSAAKLW
jgi:hypothetical protein